MERALLDRALVGEKELAGDAAWVGLELTLRHHGADPLGVVGPRSGTVAERLAEERLQLAVAGEPEALGEAGDGRRLHGASIGDVGDAGHHHPRAVGLHVPGDRAELLRERFVSFRDAGQESAHVRVARARAPRSAGDRAGRQSHVRLLSSREGHQIATALPSFADRVAASAISSARIPSSMPARGETSPRSTAAKWIISSA